MMCSMDEISIRLIGLIGQVSTLLEMMILLLIPKHNQLWRRIMLLASLLLILHSICGTTGRNNRRTSRYHQDIKGKILELQCYANCTLDGGDISDDKQKTCHRSCMRDLIKRPRLGVCPSVQPSELGLISCLDNCTYDFDCPEVQKCCNSTCGTVCVDATGVREVSSLPPIPKIINTKITRRQKALITIQSSANSTYYCHVEVRYHFGLSFTPRKLGAWQWQLVEKIAERLEARGKKTIEVEFGLKPGRWYQARVAAININGFRGYSEPSTEFRLPNSPKPPKEPADLQVVAAHRDANYYRVKIVWCPSKSNLPIEKYRIIWSLYVKNIDEFIVSNDAYVKDAHQYEITKLKPDSSYFIQVQAMSINGSRRLKSTKHELFYNTTMPAAPYNSLKCTQQYQDQEQHYNANKNNKQRQTTAQNQTNISERSDLKVQYRLNRKVGMIVQISGFQPYKEKVYELCPKDTNCEQREYNAIRAKKDSLEFSKLKYDTTYQLKPFKTNTASISGKSATTSFIFTTPKCEKFKQPFSNMPINC